jgi:hypothetical protein
VKRLERSRLILARSLQESRLSIPFELSSDEDCQMKRAITSILLFSLFSTLSSAHTHKNNKRKPDPSYSAALAAANRFLHAWQSEDHEAGIVMLSDSARQHASPEQLQSFFSPGTNAAYEIARGRRMNSESYVFPVVLFNSSAPPVRPHIVTIVVTREGKSDWAIGKLP